MSKHKTFIEEYGEVIGNTLLHKYALKKDGEYIEHGYGDIIDRILTRTKSYIGKYLTKDDFKALEVAFMGKRIILGGSILTGYGTSLLISLSNCFVVPPPEDSYDGIITTDNMLADLMKRRGGVGVDLSTIRPKSSIVNNAAKTSTGIVPFMKRYSNTTAEVAQDGRRGALMLSLDYQHKDAKDFVTAKADNSSITSANISIRADEGIFLKENEELLNNIALHMWKHAEPGLLFWDNIKDNPIDSMKNPRFTTSSTNPCGEIPLNPYSSCLLAHQNLYSYVVKPFTVNAYTDQEKMRKDAILLTKFMNTVVDEEIKHVKRILEVSEEGVEKKLWTNISKTLYDGRRIGIGKTGIGDFIAALGLNYSNNIEIENAAIVIRRAIIQTSLDIEVDAPILKIHRNRKAFMNHSFMQDTLKTLPKEYADKIPANIGFMTIAPVGTGSIIAEVSSGMEPVFSISYKRKRRATEFELDAEEDENGEKWIEFDVVHKPYLKWAEENSITENPLDHITRSPYYKNTAEDIPVKTKIELQSMLQKHTDQSISVTYNVPREFPLEEVVPLLKYAHSMKLKGFTMYRSGTREAILTKGSTLKLATDNSRPKRLKCNIHSVKIDGKDWTVLIGLINNEPYEIFALKVKGVVLGEIENAYLEKIKDEEGISVYNLISKPVKLYNVSNYYSSGSEEFITRLISRLLRLNESVADIIADFDKVSLTIGTFGNVIKRVLSTYAKTLKSNEKCPKCGSELVLEGGCATCINCSYSKCS